MIEEVRKILVELGEDPTRDGLQKTPGRVESSLRYLTSGYQQDADAILNDALFEVPYDEMVIVKNIELFSLCEHHLLPFFGKCHIAYLPDAKVIGLSKIPRLVDMFARRLQVQERLDDANRRDDQPQDTPAGCRSRGGGAASVHDNAWCRKTAFGGRHEFNVGRLQE